MLVTSTTNAGTGSTLDPSLAATFSWTTSPAQVAYQFKWREVKTIIWTSTGKVTSATTSYTVPANTFTKNKHIEWSVRVWDASQAVSAWYGMDVLIAEAETKQLIKLANENLKAVSFGKSKVASKIKFKDPDSSTYELDVVSIDDYSASKIRIKQDSGAVLAAAKKLNDYDATVYSDHSNTGNILYSDQSTSGYIAYSNQSGYSAYGNWSNGGYSAYSNWCNGGYSKYSNWSDSQGYGAYCNHSNYTYGVYSNYTVYGGSKSYYSRYTQSGYCKYSNWVNSGDCSQYSNWCNGGYSAYSNWSNGGYSVYSNLAGYAVYSNHTQTGYAAYSDHADAFSRSY